MNSFFIFCALLCAVVYSADDYVIDESTQTLTIGPPDGSVYMENYTSDSLPEWLSDENKQKYTKVVFLNTVIGIGDYALYGAPKVKSVVVQGSLDYIGKYAFSGCADEGFTRLTLPVNNATMEEHAFDGCSSLTELTIDGGVGTFNVDVFSGASLVALTVTGYIYNIATYTITPLGNSLETLTLSSVGYIDQESICRQLRTNKLKTVTISGSIDTIGYRGFAFCSNLETFTAEGSISIEGNECFRGCSNLKKVVILDLHGKIPDYTFSECEELEYLVIEGNITTSTSSAFQDCKKLENITLGSFETLPGYLFSSLTGIKKVIIKGSVGTISNAFCNWGTPESELTSLTITGSVDVIDYRAFYYCKNLVTLDIQGSVGSIGKEAFQRCESLEELSLHGLNGGIGDDAFDYCPKLRSLTIEGNITSIGSTPFTNTNALENITLGYVEALPGGLFRSKSSLKNVVIESVGSIGYEAFSSCTSLTNVTLHGLNGAIGREAFSGCTELTNCTIDGNLTEIGGSAFYGCGKLTSFNFGNDLKYIRYSAFMSCTSLTRIVIPGSVSTVESQAFYGCSGLKLVMYKGERDPGSGYSGIFGQCNSLERVLVPNSYKDKFFCGRVAKRITPAISSGSIVIPMTMTIMMLIAALLV